jgi:hypothetical protein
MFERINTFGIAILVSALVFWIPFVGMGMAFFIMLGATLHLFGYGETNSQMDAREREILEKTARDIARRQSAVPDTIPEHWTN